jgi:hypothetical protein
MSKQKKGSGVYRTLDDIEIALIKRMNLMDFARDYIMSFFIRPARVISPAVVSELDEKRPDIEPATEEEVEAYISRRMSQANESEPYQGFGPTSPIRVKEAIQLRKYTQSTLPGLESHFAEFKEIIPSDRAGRAKIAKTLASLANHTGGHIIFGISDNGTVCGIPNDLDCEKFWDQISDIVTRHFTPFFRWDRSIVEIAGFRVAVLYAFSSPDKPIICSSDIDNHIKEGHIYFRYNRSSELIKAADLQGILRERDERTRAATPRLVQ